MLCMRINRYMSHKATPINKSLKLIEKGKHVLPIFGIIYEKRVATADDSAA